MRGSVAEREEEPTLLSNLLQSVVERHPACEPLAVWQPSEPPEPICTNEPVSGEDAESVEVATAYTPAPPLETRRLLDAGWEVVASPAHVRLGVAPPEEKMGAEAVTEVTVPVGHAVLQESLVRQSVAK